MTTILDDQLYLHSDRLAGKVVLITGECRFLTCAIGVSHLEARPRFFPGGGAGIGRETALQCAKYKYVISHLLSRKKLIPHLHSPCRAKLVLGDINKSTVQRVAAEIKRAGG